MPRVSSKSKSSVSQSTDPQTEVKPEVEAKVEKIEEKGIERTSPPNHVFIGKKPIMSYAMSALIQLAQSGEITIMARGMVISRAVDVAEIVTKRLANNAYDVKNIKIDTVQLGEGEAIRNVSTIEIVIARK